MKLPYLNRTMDSISMVNVFQGLNRNVQVNEGEFADMKNISNDYFPVLSNRMRRGIINKLTKPQGVCGGRHLAYVDDNKLYYDEAYIADLEPTDELRQMVMMGAYLVVFPDGVVYNTSQPGSDLINIRNEKTVDAVALSISKLDGTAFSDSNTVEGSEEPTDKTKYWLDTSREDAVMKMWNANTQAWVSIGTIYIKIQGEGIGEGFNAYDSVRLEGIDDIGYNGYKFNYSDTKAANIVFDRGDDYILVVGLMPVGIHTNSEPVTVSRHIPDMDFVCEQNNRIWGCSSVNHEIYACKQGDPTNWEFYGGLDSDSYAATVGTEGDFTGIVSYGGFVMFFKEDGFHKLYGTKPSNYQMQWIAGRGVQFGSEKSIAIVNNRLMFKSRDAVCMYDGTPTPISSALGIETFYDAVGGSYRDKYYICLRDADLRYRMYVYDTTKYMWCIEDDIRVMYMAETSNGLYVIDYDYNVLMINAEGTYTKIYPNNDLGDLYLYPNDELYPGNATASDVEDAIEWMFETGDIGMDSPYHKYLKRIVVRLWLDYHTKMRIEIQYDSTGVWMPIMEYYATKKRSYEVPMVIRRCDHCRLRFSGFGDFKLYSIAKISEQGSAL